MQGFTLIEILIVVFIIGLTASLISLSMGDDKKDAPSYQEARAFLQTVGFVNEYAVLNGEVIAMFVRKRDAADSLNPQWCYSWKRMRDNSWSELPVESLAEHCLPEGLQWELVIEGHIYNYDPELETQPPVLVFSPSGEATPVEMVLFEAGVSESAQHIEIDMMGNSRWVEEDETEPGDAQSAAQN